MKIESISRWMCAVLHRQRDRILVEQAKSSDFQWFPSRIIVFFFFFGLLFIVLCIKSTYFYGAPLKEGFKLSTTTTAGWTVANGAMHGNFRNKSTDEVNTTVTTTMYSYDVFFPFSSCTANILSCHCFYMLWVWYVRTWEDFLTWFGLINFIFCSVLYFCVSPLGEKYWIFFWIRRNIRTRILARIRKITRRIRRVKTKIRRIRTRITIRRIMTRIII